MATINGTSDADYLIGTESSDLINGDLGNDTLVAGAGADTLIGGLGDDWFVVDSNDDVVIEDPDGGIDTVFSYVDFDLLFPDSGPAQNNLENLALVDAAVNGWGNDLNNYLLGNDLANQLRGDPGNDTIEGAAGNDFLFGDVGDDSLVAGAGDDFLDGGVGNDTLDAGLGVDTLLGGDGDDVLNVTEVEVSGRKTDTVVYCDGGAGNDTITGSQAGGVVFADYRGSSGAMVVFLDPDGAAFGPGNEVDSLLNVNGALGSSFADEIFGNLDGTSFIEGMAGDDSLFGSATSELSYSNSPDAVTVNLAKNKASDGWGNTDHIVLFARVIGSKFDDELKGSILDEEFEGGKGNDTINGGSNFTVDYDWARYDDAKGAVLVDLGAGTAEGLGGGSGIGKDELRRIDGVRGSDFDDVLRGGGKGALQLDLGDIGELFDIGDVLLRNIESFEGRAGNDTLDGGDTSAKSWDIASYTNSPFAVIVNLGKTERVFGSESVGAWSALDGYGVNGHEEGVDRLENINGADGSAFNDILVAGGGAQRLNGGEGDDYLEGGGGADVLDGGAGDDTIYGGAGDDIFIDSAGNDVLYGEDGNDIFGAYDVSFDSVVLVTGGAGRDSYVIDPLSRLFDITDFQAGPEGDLLYGGYLIAAAALEGVFEDGDPITKGYIIFEQSGADTLVKFDPDGAAGPEGAVTYHILLDLDASTLTFDNVTGLLLGGADSDSLIGGTLGEVIVANAGDDTLDGGAGADTMLGGDGEDVYYVDELEDQVLETSSEAIAASGLAGVGDTVIAAINYSIANLQDVENLVLSGSAKEATGNALANVLKGDKNKDLINGGGGNDTLFGGLGKDTLSGEGGDDSFQFDSKLSSKNIDSITDFARRSDKIVLDNDIFSTFSGAGGLSSAAFLKSASAVQAADASDRIIYNTSTGALYYDRDGAGGAAAVQFAVLSNKASLLSSDFLIVE